ncbi:hypothetical protein BDP27DRAFT_1547116 [Rhodocollybia butyracea]|uniref:Uncharacterized protein n=1 Tax=Rhodocollybia butyracea TaxID=206335 RepID=A0A9P5PMM2_9AGAR|nr:hypothetical protein BDP27DRAFT_1547116 [Rhodocollybia butyracea]
MTSLETHAPHWHRYTQLTVTPIGCKARTVAPATLQLLLGLMSNGHSIKLGIGRSFFVGDVKRTVTFKFTGTSLNVYCILPNPVISLTNLTTSTVTSVTPPIISTYNLTFTLDGSPINHVFNHASDGSGQFQYNFSVLSMSGLSLSQHTFAMSAPTQTNSTILFDYATYEFPLEDGASSSSLSSPGQAIPTSSTRPSVSSESSKHSNVAAIAGGIIGGICLLFIFGALYYYHRVRQRRIRAGKVEGTDFEPYLSHPMNSVSFANNQIHGSHVDDSNTPPAPMRSIDTSIRKPPMRMQNSNAPESIYSGREGSEREAIIQLRSNLESLQHEFRSQLLPPTYEDAV